MYFQSGLYLIGYVSNRKNSHLSANRMRNIKSDKIQSNVTLRSNRDVCYVFVSFVCPAIGSSLFETQKGGYFKIF